MAHAIVRDGQGVEYSLSCNVGRLSEVRLPAPPKGRNGRLTILVDGFKHPVTGSYDSRDSELNGLITMMGQELNQRKIAALTAMQANPSAASTIDPLGEPINVAFRLEVVRDPKVDPNLPWDQVSTEIEAGERHRRFVAIQPAETPAANDLIAHTEAEIHGRPVTNQPNPLPAPMTSGGTKADTWGFSATLALVTLAFDILSEAKENGIVPGVTTAGMEGIARLLGGLCDKLQTTITSDKVNRNAHSHTRVRGVLREVLRRYPFPVDPFTKGETEIVDRWLTQATSICERLLTVASKLHDEAA